MTRAFERPESASSSTPPSVIALAERAQPVVHSDPEIMGGTPVFVGTRVPLAAMFDYLTAGDSLDRFLDHFPTVNRQQAVATLELAREALLEAARARSA